jgi:biotin transport system ATP-binding protein
MRNRDRVRAVLAGLDQQVVFATHDLEFALDAQRVVVVDRGRVVHDGSPAESVDAYRRLMGVR